MEEAAKENIGTLLKVSFYSWGRTNEKYKVLFSTLTKPILKIAEAAFAELPNGKPGSFDSWWIRNHNRFIRLEGIRQRELHLLHEIMFHFLTAFTRGELKRDDKRSGNKPTVKPRDK